MRQDFDREGVSQAWAVSEVWREIRYGVLSGYQVGPGKVLSETHITG